MSDTVYAVSKTTVQLCGHEASIVGRGAVHRILETYYTSIYCLNFVILYTCTCTCTVLLMYLLLDNYKTYL